MTNNPFEKEEYKVLSENKDRRYKVSIRLDDLFTDKVNFFNKLSIIEYLGRLIKNYKPVYFAISTNNFEELA